MSAEENSAAPSPSVAAVIVNYQTGDLVLRHLPALIGECAQFRAGIIVVDNASPNGDGALLSRGLAGERSVTFIQSDSNRGFSAGNNIALRRLLAAGSPPDFILLMNPDAKPEPGMLAALVEFLMREPKAGFAGARLEDEKGKARISAFRYFSVINEFEGAAQLGPLSRALASFRVAPHQEDRIYAVDWLCAAALLVRREVFEQVGLFDEGYFLYYEETDLMLRAKRAGWAAWYVPQARALHLEGRATGVVSGVGEDRTTPDFWFRSRARYFRKNHGPVVAVLADLAWSAGALINMFRLAVTGRSLRRPRQEFARLWSIRSERTE